MSKVPSIFVGSWRIVEMGVWDQDFIDLVQPGMFLIERDLLGSFCFGAVEAEIDWQEEGEGEGAKMEFAFDGFDEGDPVSGTGWARVKGRQMEGELLFSEGDSSSFRAKKRGG
jgi:hypothetical protein